MLEHVDTGTHLYFLHMLQDNGMGIQFKWKEIKDISVAIFGDSIFDDIVKNEIVETCSDNEIIEVTNLNNIDSNLPRSQREALYSAIIKFLSSDENVPGIMEIIYASRKIGRAIMDSINMNIIINKLEDRYINLRIAMAMASSMDFYYSVTFRSFCKTRLDKVQFSIDNYEKYLGNDVAIGLEFLSGSILFLSQADSIKRYTVILYGHYLFFLIVETLALRNISIPGLTSNCMLAAMKRYTP